MARSSLRSTAPSQALTVVTICFTVFGSLMLALVATMAMAVVDSARRYPQADSGGPIIAFGAIILLGWTPLPGVFLTMFWKGRASDSLVLPGRSLHAIGEAVGVRPTIGWVGRAILRIAMIAAVLLILYQFFADSGALPPEPVLILQGVVLIGWTATYVELLVRISHRLHRRPTLR
ncbi:hypothetical protein [Enemella evansiae]|uniref:hypothetical protein n=1 Tax=Enemella evansiae TaxID=2016499 RepID=UPI000B95CAAC|nr:hypothetical protein [Enemella evansiae]OYO01956.1 hypothetical protein CGZ97_16245 [Enemella evansiae]